MSARGGRRSTPGGRKPAETGPSAEERKAILEREVRERTREFRATLREKGDFEAVLVRQVDPVDHRRHLIVFATIALLAGLLATVVGPPLLLAVLAAPAAYALFWIGLTITRGDQVERLWVDGQGQVSSVSSGRSLDLRGDVLRVAIPVLVIAVSGCIAAVLIHDLVFPPLPDCPFGYQVYPPHRPVLDNEFCQFVPSPTGGSGGYFTVGQVKALNSALRLYGLAISLVVFVPAVWFLWRMLTGRYVLGIRPVRRPKN